MVCSPILKSTAFYTKVILTERKIWAVIYHGEEMLIVALTAEA